MTPRVNFDTRSLSLRSGDYVFGVTEPDPEPDGPKILTGGYRITVPDAPPNAFVYAEVESITREQKFGPNIATATLVDELSATAVAARTQTGLRYETTDGRWFPANRGTVEHDLLEQIVTTASAGESTDVFVPGYDPRTTVATAVDLLLDVPQGSTVGLYSPGTPTHWGTKGDIRSEYERYGLSPETGAVDNAVPLHTICSHTTISGGSLKDTSSESQLVITKDVDELIVGPQLDYLIVNHLSRAILDDREKLRKLIARWSTTPTITLWSTYTKREGEGVPVYGPPFDREALSTPNVGLTHRDVDGHQTAVARESYEPPEKADSLPVPPTTTDFEGLCSDHTVRLERLDAPSVTETLREAFEEWQKLSDAGSEQGARLVFNAIVFFHRLPLPREYYDDIIRQRAYDGDIYLPKIGEDHLEDIESHVTDGEYSLLHAQKTLESVQYELQSDNPMFERLLEYSKEARTEDRRIAILVNSKTMAKLLETALCSELLIDDLGTRIHVVNPDSARDIPSVDQIVVCGPQRPGYKSFYLHPRAEETVVLTYTDWGERMIERHAREYAENLNAILPADVEISLSDDPEVEYEGRSEPTVDPNDVPDDPEPSGSTDTVSERDDDETDSEPTSPSTDFPEDLTDRDVDRLRSIKERQPTKNGELCDQWGYDSGSDLYQYLSSNLDPYYERNDDSLIVLTGKGEAVLAASNHPT